MSKKIEETIANTTGTGKAPRVPKDTLFCIKRDKNDGYIVIFDEEMPCVDYFCVLNIIQGFLDERTTPASEELDTYPLKC
jgi:hypothetical protein